MSSTEEIMDPDLEMNSYEQEILHLEKLVEEQEQQNLLLKTWQEYQQGQNFDDDCDDILRARVEGLKHQIETLKELNGVTITDVTTDIVRQEKLHTMKVKHVNGTCGHVEFQLEMHVEESMDFDATVHAKITHLAISASECVYRDLKETVEKLAEEGSVQGFLTLLQPYNIWFNAREKTIDHFIKTYPKVASRASWQVLRLSHPVKKCSFEIHWSFKVTDTYNVLPDMSLSVHVPKKAHQTNRDVLEMASEKFQLMLQDIGIENTINLLVTLLT